MSDVVELATQFVDIASPSRNEGPLADHIESLLRATTELEVTRIGDNVVARTNLGRPYRVILAGHLDTVPLDHAPATRSGEAVHGLGIVDMKGTLAVMVDIAQTVPAPAIDVTWVFYAREEIARAESGLQELIAARPELLVGDAAILGEPTDAAVEAGCQGTMHARISLWGSEAHTARPYMGVNAIHRLGDLLGLVANASLRTATIDGVEYAEQLQAVGVEGGRTNNVVPGAASLTVNFRFAPDRTINEAEAWLRDLVAPVLDEVAGDRFEILEVAPPALPGLEHPILARLVELSERPVVAKVGWTDVATFAELGVPAANFGAGDARLAHHPGEQVEIASLRRVRDIFAELLDSPPQV